MNKFLKIFFILILLANFSVPCFARSVGVYTKNDKYGYVGERGYNVPNIIMMMNPFVFLNPFAYMNIIEPPFYENSHYYIRKSKKYTIPAIYDDIKVVSNYPGILIVTIDNKKGIISGRDIKTPIIFDDVDYLGENGFIVTKDGKQGLISLNDYFDEATIEEALIYDKIKKCKINNSIFYLVLKDNKIGICLKSDYCSPVIYDKVEPITYEDDIFFKAYKDNKVSLYGRSLYNPYGFDKTFEVLALYDDIIIVDNNTIITKLDNKYGLYTTDHKNNIVKTTDEVFDNKDFIVWNNTWYICVKRNNKCGVYKRGKSHELIVPIKYDNIINPEGRDYFITILGNKKGIFGECEPKYDDIEYDPHNYIYIIKDRNKYGLFGENLFIEPVYNNIDIKHFDCRGNKLITCDNKQGLISDRIKLKPKYDEIKYLNDYYISVKLDNKYALFKYEDGNVIQISSFEDGEIIYNKDKKSILRSSDK